MLAGICLTVFGTFWRGVFVSDTMRPSCTQVAGVRRRVRVAGAEGTAKA
jgi:hypothetical protein